MYPGSDGGVTNGGHAAYTNTHFTSPLPPPSLPSASSACSIRLEAATPPPSTLQPAAVHVRTVTSARTSSPPACAATRSSIGLRHRSNHSQEHTMAVSSVSFRPSKQTVRSTSEDVYLEPEKATSQVRIAELDERLQDALKRGVNAGSPKSDGACGCRFKMCLRAKSATAALPFLNQELPSVTANAPPVISGTSVAMTTTGTSTAAPSTLHRNQDLTPNPVALSCQRPLSVSASRPALPVGGSLVLSGVGVRWPVSPMTNSDRCVSTPHNVIRSFSPARSAREVDRPNSPLRLSREVTLVPSAIPLKSEPLRSPSPVRIPLRATSELLHLATPTNSSSDAMGLVPRQPPMLPAQVVVASTSRPSSPQPPLHRRGAISPRRGTISPKRDETPRRGSSTVSSNSIPSVLFPTASPRSRCDRPSRDTSPVSTGRAMSPCKASPSLDSWFPKILPLEALAGDGCARSPLKLLSGPPPPAMSSRSSSSLAVAIGSPLVLSQVPVPSPAGRASAGSSVAEASPKSLQMRLQLQGSPTASRFYSFPSGAAWQSPLEQLGGGSVEAGASRSSSRSLNGRVASRSNSQSHSATVRQHSVGLLGVAQSFSARARVGGPSPRVISGARGGGGSSAIVTARDVSPLVVRPLHRGTVPRAIPVSASPALPTGVGEAALIAAAAWATSPSLMVPWPQPCGADGSGQPQSGNVAATTSPFCCVKSGSGNAGLGQKCAVSPCEEANVAMSTSTMTKCVGETLPMPGGPSVAQVGLRASTVSSMQNSASTPWGESLHVNGLRQKSARSIATSEDPPRMEAIVQGGVVQKLAATRQASPAKNRSGTDVDCLRREHADPRMQAMELAASPNPSEAAGKEDADWHDVIQYWRSVGGDTLRKLGMPHKGVRQVGLV
eukprot:TRINITY_DN38109_c0_g1_i1.p1 TRINITY_DN38109_c0_g1~~TRINITY_DN38109_c0_g1_i1.p1  ORF type:complete len:895 (-),score=120.36 TRINITY_DN38109_c0_g1_i1:76-2760(-)